MKQIRNFILLALLMNMTSVSVFSQGYEGFERVEVDGVGYWLWPDNDDAWLVSISSTFVNFQIPKEVEYNNNVYKVNTICGFGNCPSLESINIPSTVKQIFGGAFSGCTSLKHINIEYGSTSLAVGAYKETEENGEGLFYPCPLESVYLGRALNYNSRYGYSPFAKTPIKKVTIGSKLTTIQTYLFLWCKELESITLGENVKKISDRAFENCTSLTSIEIPASVTTIGRESFHGCSGLTSIVVAAGNPNYDSRENCNALIETSSNTLLQGCKTTVIPNSVTSIGEGAFLNYSGLTSIEIPTSVTSIGSVAFWGCKGLTKIISHAIVPPACDVNLWLDINKSACTLYVPAGTKAAYAAATGWKEFSVIKELDTTDIQTIENEAGTDICEGEIFTIDGQRVNELQGGLNIVRLKDSKVKKIIKQ